MTDDIQGTIVLGRVEGIDTAEELLLKLRTAIESHGDIAIDAGAVISIDSTTLQMLVAAIRQTLVEGATVTWVNTSKKFLKTAELLGLTPELHM